MVLVWAWMVSSVASANDEGEHGSAEPHRNAVAIKGIYALHLLQDRESANPDLDAPDQDQLGGFVLSYERVLVDEWLNLELAKPFLFGSGRFDSPFDASLVVVRRWRKFEPFLGAGITFNVRVFDAEREEIEGRASALSFGFIGAAGAAFWVTEKTAIGAEIGASRIVAGPVVDGELTAAAGLMFAF